MENYNLNSDSDLSNLYSYLKYKRKRETFTSRMDSLIELPDEIITQYTNYSFLYDNSIPICLEKLKNDNKKYLPHFNQNESLEKNNSNFIDQEIQQKDIALKEEIDEIVNELEIFARENRKKRMIKIMEKIAENINGDLFDIDELLDYHFFGNKVSNIESEYLDCQKRKYSNNIKLCEYTNKLLMNDDDQYFNKLNHSNDNNIEDK